MTFVAPRQCYPVLGKKDSADEGPTRFSTAPKGSEADRATGQRVIPISNGTSSGGIGVPGLESTPAHSGDNNVTPFVKTCRPGELSVGSACVRSAAGSAVFLAAWQLVVVLATALLVC